MTQANTPPDLRDAFIDAMSRAATTVCVVTTDGPAGRAGVTVSAMTSVSADGDAPTILICVNKTASAAPAILENKCFAVNVLTAEQQGIANTFAGRSDATGAERFTGLSFDILKTGAPVLHGLAGFDCEIQSIDPIGTHYVIIGAVRAVRAREEGTPLIYGMRSYLKTAKA